MKWNQWYRRSRLVIEKAIHDGKTAGETPEQIRLRVRKAYPFGVRSYWPYTQWLCAQRELFATFNLRTEREKARDAEAIAKSPLQIAQREAAEDPRQQRMAL